MAVQPYVDKYTTNQETKVFDLKDSEIYILDSKGEVLKKIDDTKIKGKTLTLTCLETGKTYEAVAGFSELETVMLLAGGKINTMKG